MNCSVQMPPPQDEWPIMESGTRTGWLFNYHPTSVAAPESAFDRHGGSGVRAALVLLFTDHEREVFQVNLFYNPYIFVSAVEGHEHEVELGMMSLFGPQLICHIEIVEKEDLDLINHLSGRKRLYLKVSFSNVQDLTTVRGRLEKIVKRNASMGASNTLLNPLDRSIGDVMAKTFEDDPVNSTTASERWFDWVHEIREYDVKYSMRVGIDLGVFVGLWYDVKVHEGETQLIRCDLNAYAPAMPRVCAFDIETTKAPLKFPQPEVDQIYMISYVLDGRGYLIVNREIVATDIHQFEYTPKPEYEGIFDTFNEPDEKALLQRFYSEMRLYQPTVYVTYNGDYFDFPFIHARSLFHHLSMREELGFSQNSEGAFVANKLVHLDCFYWVKRDSYLPQGSQGLKAVTKYKLGYEPIEVDPEDMLPLAQSNPQQMASYSVSDALSTWFLYQKYVHPFIYSLSTIIPMAPDDVLRKGSGGLCESLLMVQAYANNVIFPNKKEIKLERFFNGHLIDSETYIGGRVEALRSGVYRSDIPIHFQMSADMYQKLIDDLDDALRFSLEVENSVKMNEVTNYEEIRDSIKARLEVLRDRPSQYATPIIYHLDVGAMYPNIILTNRLQPYAIPKAEVCAGCCFNSPTNEHFCKRTMAWKWKGEFLTAGRHEYQRVKAQLENESFAESVIQQANLSAVQKKTYGNRKDNVLEGTAYEKKRRPFAKRQNDVKSDYRHENNFQRQEARNALLHKEFQKDQDGSGSDEDEDAGGPKAYYKLQESTKFNMLKKRLAEYSRKAYGKIHESREIMRSDVVCQRENSFYVDTVRLFRDRRYEYKAALKTWKKRLDNAKDTEEIKLCKSRCVQMESLQLAHKCILNSFYGYVMRKGSRWYSMEMAGIVTYLGATLIQMARALVQQIGVTLELDTDGIWCCLPNTFPENFTFTTTNPSTPKVTISYPCIVLNKMVHDGYTNHQYQTCVGPGLYERRSECSIYFEVDGPYLAMMLPASREEGKGIKKRYAVFDPDGRLADLKGFELKRRGELMLIKDFQSQVFRRFLDGTTLVESYASAAVAANVALDMLYSKGEGYDPEEILEKLSESSNMTRRLSEYPDSQKSLALTTARRIGDFLGPQMVKDKGLACQFVISRLPSGRPVTERAIPLTIFRADPAIRTHFLRKWTGDNSISANVDLQHLLDWDYYIARYNACVQKIITIPAALQQVPNPVPRVPYPDWLQKRVQQLNSRFKQTTLTNMFVKAKPGDGGVPDVEDLVTGDGVAPSSGGEKDVRRKKNGSAGVVNGDVYYLQESEGTDSDVASIVNVSDDEGYRLVREAELHEIEDVEMLKSKYFAPNSNHPMDAAFFADARVGAWLKLQKQAWTRRATLRRQMMKESELLTADGQPTSSHFIDVKTKALSTTWHIMEIRTDKADDGTVAVIAALDKTLYTFRCIVPRRIVVDADHNAFLPSAKPVTNALVLPRSRSSTNLLHVDLPPGREGERMLNGLLTGREDVHMVYEDHITRAEVMIEKIGCCANVLVDDYLRNARQRPYARGTFSVDELTSVPTGNYLQNSSNRFVFLFHVASDTRGIIGLVNHFDHTAFVAIIQPASAPAPTINWRTLFFEAAQSLNSTEVPLDVTWEVVADTENAWRLVYRSLNGVMEGGGSPLFAVLESSITTTQLIEQRCLPSSLPYLRILGAAEDERLLSDPFRWTRLLARRLLQRYCASLLWVEERISFSRLSRIPLCNLMQDTSVHAWDVLFTRALHARAHVLWNSRDVSIAFDSIEERPRQVVMPGGYLSWGVEFSLARLDVVAVLFSQLIQEGDDPNAHALCNQGVTTHFNILRDLVSDLLGQVRTNAVADVLLASFSRWIRDPVSSCYEPRLLELVSTLAHRALTTVLFSLAKLGGRTVKVDGDSIVVLTPKHTIQDTVSFARFMVDSLKDQPMLLLLSLKPIRYWCPFVILDKRDYVFLYVTSEGCKSLKEKDQVVLDEMLVEYSFTIWSKLPKKVRDILLVRIEGTLRAIALARESVLVEVQEDPTVVLATKNEQILTRIVGVYKKLVEGKLHTELIEEVHDLTERKDLHEKGFPAGETTLTGAAVALEYTKVVCRLLELFPNDGVLGKVRNNCLRLCGVSPFSPLAQITADADTDCHQLMFQCSFCNADVLLDLSIREKRMRCNGCSAPIFASAVESYLVRKVNTLVMSYTKQDFVCGKCHEVTANSINQTCCGPLVGKAKPIHTQLQALKKVAVIQGFAWLEECVETALQFS
ncbi:DNA polymerase epsilon catalytic subunit, putative [Trypanosoma brucei brucei TREU927]|uniref:DNA polymerase epsilon catalytic subunit n=1 Tax=Trypanosoma brucei brucei (strain 927/4 GUTat10.1) TaxID=185431 RepID=Q38DX2_TRYB2|nr:DNA polymerase epsilon catalytic subunit, putative [Trypanosoma brucei brucei TREU927]EAN76998.1 DNA polymerase epsilon catalytic subunit, putative [Trypanosoma brucei brucei TREU927]